MDADVAEFVHDQHGHGYGSAIGRQQCLPDVGWQDIVLVVHGTGASPELRADHDIKTRGVGTTVSNHCGLVGILEDSLGIEDDLGSRCPSANQHADLLEELHRQGREYLLGHGTTCVSPLFDPTRRYRFER